MKNYLFLIVMLLFLASCSDETIQTEIEEIEIIINDDFVNENPELRAKLIDAIKNEEEFVSETFTVKMDAPVSGLKNINGLAGAQIIYGTLGNFRLFRGTYVLHGYNVVDDLIQPGSSDRFTFLASDSSFRVLKLYTYDDNLNTANMQYVSSSCSPFAFTTNDTTWPITGYNNCGW